MIPDVAFSLDPNSLVYRLAMAALSNAMGPALRLMFKLKNPAKLIWFEKFLSVVTGRDVSMGELDEIGERVFNLERLYNLREGIDRHSDTLPSRLLEESLSRHQRGGVPLREMLPTYYQLRGWDTHGVPRAKTIRRLGIRT